MTEPPFSIARGIITCCCVCHAQWSRQLRGGEMPHRFRPSTVRAEKFHRGIPA